MDNLKNFIIGLSRRCQGHGKQTNKQKTEKLPKNKETWQLNAVWYHGLDLGTEKKIIMGRVMTFK